MAESLVFIPSVSSSHGNVLRRGVTCCYIQSNPLPLNLHTFFHLSESVMSHGMKTNPEYTGKIIAASLLFSPFLAHHLICFRAWNLKTFTAYSGVAGCNQKVGRTEVSRCGYPHRGHACGNPDWSFKEWKQFQGDAAKPGR